MRKTTIVTGANSGIGYETAVGMAKAGFHVVMACRSQERGEQALHKIAETVSDASLEVMLLDLSDSSSIRGFVDNFRQNHSQLDVLINNAGVLVYSGKTNDDGTELNFATNHLGHFMLTSLLIDLIPDNRMSRIVSLSSIAHKPASIRFDDINCKDTDEVEVAYGQSKLACLMFADELNRRLQAAGKATLSLCAHPGGSDSGLFDEMSPARYLLLKTLSPFIIHSNAKAAMPSLHAALSEEVEGGDYFGPQGFMELKGKVGHAKRSKTTSDLEAAARLWTLSEEMTGQSFSL